MSSGFFLTCTTDVSRAKRLVNNGSPLMKGCLRAVSRKAATKDEDKRKSDDLIISDIINISQLSKILDTLSKMRS